MYVKKYLRREIMNIEQLNYIVKVDKTKSLAKAAKKLHVSSSALSQAITKLEDELNVKLFIRSRTGVKTTKAGLAIIEKAQATLYSIYQIREEAKYQADNTFDLLKIASIPGLTGFLIDNYLSLKKTGTELTIEVIEKGSMDIIDDIKNDKTDI